MRGVMTMYLRMGALSGRLQPPIAALSSSLYPATFSIWAKDLRGVPPPKSLGLMSSFKALATAFWKASLKLE